jgi:hypothetical protein
LRPYREGEIDVGGLFPAHVDAAGSGADDVLAKQTGIDVDQRCAFFSERTASMFCFNCCT